MRVNVYAEELLPNTEMITKHVEDEAFGERTFYGVRMYLDSPTSLHHGEHDDDRSAVTIFVPWTQEQGHDFARARQVLLGLIQRLGEAEDDANGHNRSDARTPDSARA